MTRLGGGVVARRSDAAAAPGVPLYRSFGFEALDPIVIKLLDGVTLDALVMERPIGPAPVG